MSALVSSNASAPPDAAVARLALVLKHRLSSLTSSIEGYTDLLADTLGSSDQRDLAFRIFEGVRGIDQVLADLDVIAARPNPNPAPTSAQLLTERLIAGLGDGASRLVVDLEGPDALTADADLVLRALIALTRNALEATDETILLHVYAGEDGYRFDVWNAGAPDEAFDVLVRPFFTTKTRHMGLGLPYAQSIAQAHGGALTAHVVPGCGTCFRLCLPDA
jgi:signal transduction histidine kinase